MSTIVKIALFTFLLALTAYAQFPSTNPNELTGSLGPTWIDNAPYYAIRLRPEFEINKIGVGLDLNLEFDASGQLRKENFNEVSDYVSIIRYVRYGNEVDPFFIRLGALDYATLGHGSIINQYNNSPSFDTRKTGMQMNLNFDKFGFQTLYGNFGQAGVAGVRGYVHPLQFTSQTDIPVVSNIEVGATYATDFDKYARVTAFDPLTGVPTADDGALSIYGFDIGFPILRNGMTSIDLYADYSKIVDFGSGTAVGGMFHFDLSSLVKVQSKLERRFNGDHYIAGYFNTLYETERYNTTTGVSKSAALSAMTGDLNGYYGDLLVQVAGTFNIIGSFQKLDKVSNSGILHLTTDIMPTGAPYIARAGYDKVEIEDFTDLFTTDDRSYLYAEVGYKPLPYLITSMRYSWTFTPIRDGGNIIGYEPQRKIEPRVTFVYQLAQ